jgi:ABC-2 type transport system permease protein
MRTTLIIAAHHIRRVARNPGLVLVLLAIPLTLATIEYFAFGRTAAVGKLPPTVVLVLDQDQTLVSGAVSQVFSSGPAKEMFDVKHVADRDEAAAIFRRGNAAALVVVPKGFQSAVLAGTRAEVMLYRNPVLTIGPGIVASVLDMSTVLGNGIWVQAMAPIGRMRDLIDAKRNPTGDEVAVISREFFEAGRRMQSLDGLSGLSVDLQRPGKIAKQTGFGSDPSQFFAYVFPGLVIFALMFIAQTLAMRLLRDRLSGLQRRSVVTPASPTSIVMGGVLYMVAGLMVLLICLAAIGALIFRIELRDPGSLLAIGTGFAVFAAGLQLLTVSLSDTDRAAGFIGSVLVMVLALLGGTFLPAETYPPFLRSVAMITPNGAAQQGFIDVLVARVPLVSLGGRLAITWLWGAVTLGLGVFFERRRLRL